MRVRRTWAAAVFVVVFAIQVASPVNQVLDSFETILVAQNVVEHRSVSLEPYRSQLPANYTPLVVHGKVYPWYPLGTPFVAVPFVAGADFFHHELGIGPRLDDARSIFRSNWFQVIVASTIVASTAALIFLIADFGLEKLEPRRRRLWAFGVAMVFAFGTAAWSIASRALWQHGPSMFCLALASYLAMRSKREPRFACWLGLPLGVSYFVRPTNAIAIVVFTIWVLLYRRRQALAYAVGLGLILGAFVFVSENSYHALLAPYYTQRRVHVPGTALAGQLVSPSRGLFIFSPILVLSIIGAVLALRRKNLDNLSVALGIVVIAHWVTVSGFDDWSAGYSYGPRYMSDMIPFLVVLALPAVTWLALARPGPAKTALGAGTTVLVGASVLFNLGGAWSDRAMAWNSDAPLTNHRLWSWSDPQFLRGLSWLAPHGGYSQLVAFLALAGVTAALVISARRLPSGGRGLHSRISS